MPRMMRNPETMRLRFILHSAFRVAVGAALCLVLCAAMTGCQKEKRWGSLKNEQGFLVRWKPAVPLLGDLVYLEINGNAPDATVIAPDGIGIQPSAVEYSDYDPKSSWVFRVRLPGEWKLVSSGKKMSLWTVETVAGGATELKTLDAQSLWSGAKAQP